MDTYSTTPKAQETISALWRLEKIILNSLDFNDVVQKIVESVLSELGYLQLGYRVVVLALVDDTTQTLKRISFSRTKEAEEAIGALSVPFGQIEIPLTEANNFCIKAMQQRQPFVTHTVADVFYPTLTAEEILPIQNRVGIKTTMVYPVFSKDKAVGVLIFSLIKSEEEVSKEEKDLLASFTDVVGLAVQNSQLYSSLQTTTQELQKANEQLQQLDKLKDEFVSLASHELRTPMTAIQSYLWLVLQQGDIGSLNEKQKVYLDRTYNATTRLLHLVEEMLNVSRIESGRMTIAPKPVQLEVLTESAIAEILPTAREHAVALLTEKPPQVLPTVLADEEKIKEVLINLIGNSLKFTPSGGEITISFEMTPTTVSTKVRDTGRGIKKEDMPKLFQKFGLIEGNYLKNAAEHGTGLGLYITKSIIHMHGGEVTAFSEGEGKGSEFTFSIPRIDTTQTQ